MTIFTMCGCLHEIPRFGNCSISQTKKKEAKLTQTLVGERHKVIILSRVKAQRCTHKQAGAVYDLVSVYLHMYVYNCTYVCTKKNCVI